MALNLAFLCAYLHILSHLKLPFFMLTIFLSDHYYFFYFVAFPLIELKPMDLINDWYFIANQISKKPTPIDLCEILAPSFDLIANFVCCRMCGISINLCSGSVFNSFKYSGSFILLHQTVTHHALRLYCVKKRWEWYIWCYKPTKNFVWHLMWIA